MLSSIDINNIATSHNPNGFTQNQDQSLSVPLAQYSVNRAYPLADLDTPKDTTDDISSTLARTSEQDIDNADNNSEISESQSIDINVINLNNNVANDCESMSRSPTQQSIRTDDSVLTDEKEDSIASRMKRRRNQQSEDNDDKNNSYEY